MLFPADVKSAHHYDDHCRDSATSTSTATIAITKIQSRCNWRATMQEPYKN